VHEILNRLPADARVLDLGCGHGSFPAEHSPAPVIRADLDWNSNDLANRVCCDARYLPFKENSFDAVILNHSLEHILEPARALSEIARVMRRPGSLYIAVPDASTITDRIYRWLGRGGGHVNPFTSVIELVRLVSGQTGLPSAGTRLLFTSLSFLNRRNIRTRIPRRLYLLGGGAEWVLRLGTLLLRLCDRYFHTRLSVYGWAFWFGAVADIDNRPWSNVCIRCGSGEPSSQLLARGLVWRNTMGLRAYRCPACSTKNYFTDDPAQGPGVG